MGQRSQQQIADDDHRERRDDEAEAAKRFEDIAAWALMHYAGIVVVPYGSRHFQYNVGENSGGVEFKNDKNFRKTGNLYIETAEKSVPSIPDWTPSGIYRSDNQRHYAIGDIETIYLFGTRTLRGMGNSGKYRKARDTPTAQGWLLPIAEAEKYATDVIHIQASDLPYASGKREKR